MSRLVSLIRPVAAAAALGLLTLEASAQTLPWTTTFPPTSPAGRERVFTGTDGVLSYVYGGQSGTTTIGRDELYSWDGTDWTLLSPSGTGPTQRCGGASCYDMARGKFVVFGGKQDWINNLVLNDTWEWDSTNGWVQVTTANSPSARWLIGDTCAYVPGLGLVFHGGNDAALAVKSTETWAYDGVDWTLLSSTGPDRQVASLAYRPTQNDMILYGGVGNATTLSLTETWRFDLGTYTWSQITTVTLPGHPSATGGPGLSGQVTYFNPVTGKVVIYGGQGNGSGGTASHMTWEFDGTDWADATDPAQLTSENVRNTMACWVDNSQSAIVLMGNRNNGSSYDFVLEHGPWIPPAPGVGYCFGDGSGTPCPCSNDNDGSVPGSGCANGASPAGALLVGSGTASLSADTLVLSATGLDPSNSGLYFQANNDLSPGNVWGDGLQCAGGQLKRLGVRFADVNGASDTSAWTTPISVKAGNILPGDTKRYQLWYRDNSGGQPCGVGVNDFNATNGYAVVWGA